MVLHSRPYVRSAGVQFSCLAETHASLSLMSPVPQQRSCPPAPRTAAPPRLATARRLRRSRSRASTCSAQQSSASSLVALELAGFSCSPDGFAALLRCSGDREDLLPLRVTEGRDDASSPSSPRALTLLLLSQRPVCDLGTPQLFPPEALARLLATAAAAAAADGDAAAADGAAAAADVAAYDDAVLNALVVTSGQESAAGFSAQLLASSGDAPHSAVVDDAWLAVALWLRYAPFGARLFATSDALASGAVSKAEALARWPQYVSVETVREEGAAALAALRNALP